MGVVLFELGEMFMATREEPGHYDGGDVALTAFCVLAIHELRINEVSGLIKDEWFRVQLDCLVVAAVSDVEEEEPH